MYVVTPTLRRCGFALLTGIATATLWVNLNPASYYDALESRLLRIPLPEWLAANPVIVTPLWAVSHILMPLFVFFLAKELFEALKLEHDPQTGWAQIGLPLGAVIGGMAGAALVWLVVSPWLQTDPEATLTQGWPVPLGSDVLLCYLVAVRVFGSGHRAVRLLLLIAVGQDLLGLLTSSLAAPPAALRPAWLALPLLAAFGVWWLYGRRAHSGASEVDRRAANALPPYLMAAGLCWLGMALANLPPALALLPMVAVIPHAARSFGLFAEAEGLLHDPLNRITLVLLPVLPAVMLAFGLTRGGIDLAALTPETGTVLAALWLGKPLGMLVGALLAVGVGRAAWTPGLTLRDLCLIAVILGAGFTVPALAIDESMPGGAMAEAARLGLALSLLAGPAAFGLARLWTKAPHKF